MMKPSNDKPLLVDLFCKAGGATAGFQRAGFYVIGVDIEAQPNYCGDEFIQADAIEYFKKYWRRFDAAHASPPCQGYSLLAFAPNRDMSSYPMLIDPVREMFIESGLPYSIENVTQAPLINPLVLCGTMFGLRTHKHRAFETNPPIYFYPAGCNKARVKPKGSGKRLGQYYGDDALMVTVAGHQFSSKAGSRAMGIDWMTRHELAEAIPPAFAEYVGAYLMRAVMSRRGRTLHAPDKGYAPAKSVISAGSNPISSDGTTLAPCG